jgi:hypothetical protein
VATPGAFDFDDDGVMEATEKRGSDDGIAEDLSHSAKPRFQVTIIAPSWALTSWKNKLPAPGVRRRQPAQSALASEGASILTTAFHILRDGTSYQDLSPEYFARRNPAKQGSPIASATSAIMRRLPRPHSLVSF